MNNFVGNNGNKSEYVYSLYADLEEMLSKDPGLVNKIKQDPRAFLKKINFELDSSVNYEVVVQTDGVLYFVVPVNDQVALSDEHLVGVIAAKKSKTTGSLSTTTTCGSVSTATTCLACVSSAGCVATLGSFKSEKQK